MPADILTCRLNGFRTNGIFTGTYAGRGRGDIEHSFETVRVAPLYDAVTTVVFPGLEHDRMALRINGKDNRLSRADFLRTAAVAGLTADATNQAMDAVLTGFGAGIDAATIPNVSGVDEDIAAKAEQMLRLCHERVDAFE